MNTMLLIILLMAGLFLCGLVLLVIGGIILWKARNHVAGWIMAAVGLLCILLSPTIFLLVMFANTAQG